MKKTKCEHNFKYLGRGKKSIPLFKNKFLGFIFQATIFTEIYFCSKCLKYEER